MNKLIKSRYNLSNLWRLLRPNTKQFTYFEPMAKRSQQVTLTVLISRGLTLARISFRADKLWRIGQIRDS